MVHLRQIDNFEDCVHALIHTYTFLNVWLSAFQTVSSSLTVSISGGTRSTGGFTGSRCPLNDRLNPGRVSSYPRAPRSVSSQMTIFAPGFATRIISVMAFCLLLKKLIPPIWKTLSN